MLISGTENLGRLNHQESSLNGSESRDVSTREGTCHGSSNEAPVK
jgi:hypothetical protein